MTNAELDELAVASDTQQGQRMLTDVCAFLRRFISYPSEHALTAHALWCVHAHLMDQWDTTPRLAFLSAEPSSGKTRALEVTELLVPNPIAAVNVTPAYLFRKVGGDEPITLLYDEIDTVFGPKARDNEELRGLLNAGHRRGAIAGRCVVRGKSVETEEIPAYAAVAMAGIGWLPDTILSRSVIIRMRRRHAGERVESYRRRIHEREGWRLRDLITAWARSATTKWPTLPDEIQDRNADVWEPLIAIADAIGGNWPERSRVAAVALLGEGREAEASLGIRLLADLRTVFDDDDELPSKIILGRLNELEESPWGDLHGKPLDERGLAHRWQSGQSGNPAGRPLGTRNKFSESFVSDVAAVWADRGRGILEKMAEDEPARFAELCGRLIPRDVSLTISERLPGGLDADDWQITMEVLQATRQALPDANERPPGEVLRFVLDAIRAHNAIEAK
jgi:hypothetical protein